jgi:hypothetical protein
MSEAEDGIARAFGMKYKMIPRRTGEDPVNFIFHAAENGVTSGEYKGAAIVIRKHCKSESISTDLVDIGKLLDKDEKGIVIVGFDDVLVFISPKKTGLNIDPEGRTAIFDKFTIVSERKGLYE